MNRHQAVGHLRARFLPYVGAVAVTLACVLGPGNARAGEEDAAAADPAEPAGSADSYPESVEVLLKEDPDAPTSDEAPRCLSLHRLRSSEVLDSKRVAFRLSSTEYVIAELDQPCIGLERRAGLTYRSTGNRLCQFDTIQAIMKFGPVSRPGPRCSIRRFVPVSKDYLDMVKDQLSQK